MMMTTPSPSNSSSNCSNNDTNRTTSSNSNNSTTSFTTKRKLGLTINIEPISQAQQQKQQFDMKEIEIQQSEPSQVILDSDSPSTPLSMLSLSFSSSNSSSNSSSGVGSDISSDSSNSTPNTPRNKLNLKLNLQQLQQPLSKSNKMYSNNAILINQYNNNSNHFNINGNFEELEPLESSRWLGGSDMDKLKIYDLICSKVTDYLYMGSETIASNQDILSSYGITHIINASYQCPNYFEDDPKKPFIYKKFPLLDNPSEEISLVFAEVISFIEKALESNGKIFVHCQMGVSRSPCLCTLWLMNKDRCSLEEASDRIKLIRPISRPNAGFQLSLLNWAINEGIQSPNSHRSSYNNQNQNDNNIIPVKLNTCNFNQLNSNNS